MIDGNEFEDLSNFLAWYSDLNPSDEICIHEAITIYMNPEIYEGAI